MRGRSLVVSFANRTALCCANFTRVPSSDISATTTVTVYGSGSTTSYNRTVTVTELQQTTTVTISRNVSSYATTVYVTVGPTYSSLALTSTASAVLISGGGTVVPNWSYITTSTVPGPAVTTVSRTLRTSTIQTTSPTNGGIAYELTTVGFNRSSQPLASNASAVLTSGAGTVRPGVFPNLSYITTSTVPGPAITTASRSLRISTIETTSPTNGGIAYELTTSALIMRLPGPPATTITTTGMLTVYRLSTSGINGFSVVS